ncbi:MAG TPA: glycine zipper domain-containing protein [Candidatus Binataceae bacterium]|nr:glycine zipper domain-containing protein [Candidatus Binataceae bacterium]
MRKRWMATAGVALAAAMFVAGCAGSQPLSTREEGTGIGALLGGGAGAAIGAATGHPALGALIGAGAGGVGGYAVGNSMQNQENANSQTNGQLQQQQQEIENQRQQIEQMKQQQETE